MKRQEWATGLNHNSHNLSSNMHPSTTLVSSTKLDVVITAMERTQYLPSSIMASHFSLVCHLWLISLGLPGALGWWLGRPRWRILWPLSRRPDTPWKLLKDRNCILLAVVSLCLAQNRYPKNVCEGCCQMVDSGPRRWLGTDCEDSQGPCQWGDDYLSVQVNSEGAVLTGSRRQKIYRMTLWTKLIVICLKKKASFRSLITPQIQFARIWIGSCKHRINKELAFFPPTSRAATERVGGTSVRSVFGSRSVFLSHHTLGWSWQRAIRQLCGSSYRPARLLVGARVLSPAASPTAEQGFRQVLSSAAGQACGRSGAHCLQPQDTRAAGWL